MTAMRAAAASLLHAARARADMIMTNNGRRREYMSDQTARTSVRFPL